LYIKRPSEHSQTEHIKKNLWLLSLGALGVVFGDIGTSPLYALRECFSPEHGLTLNPHNILGTLSLIFWTLLIVICVKYIVFVLRADNRGEGGILSLMALALRASRLEDKSKRKWVITTLGIFGAALLYGDGVITPAISVLSAIEGLTFVTPVFEPYLIPLTVFVLNSLFVVQTFWNSPDWSSFWSDNFCLVFSFGGLGIHGIIKNPEVIWALSPVYAFQFFWKMALQDFWFLGLFFWWSLVVKPSMQTWDISESVHSTRLVFCRFTRVNFKLFRSGCLAPVKSRSHFESVLSTCAKLVPRPSGPSFDDRISHCLSSPNFRGF
jgi:KUP system potassium uptake protein